MLTPNTGCALLRVNPVLTGHLLVVNGGYMILCGFVCVWAREGRRI